MSPGPPPSPSAARRNARVGPVVLPAEGRRGSAPRWPLPDNPRLTAMVELLEDQIAQLEEKELDEGKLSRTEQTKLTRTRQRLAVAQKTLDEARKTETVLWRALWKTPQACMWERYHWTREVAQYVRWKAAAELGDLDAGKEARQYADRLGLNPKAMRTLMWTIAEDQTQERRQERKAEETATARRRTFTVHDGTKEA